MLLLVKFSIINKGNTCSMSIVHLCSNEKSSENLVLTGDALLELGCYWCQSGVFT